MTDKEKYTNRLMDAVGNIDEKYIYEAQNYTPKKRMPGYIKAIIAAAASAVIMIGSAVPLTFFSVMMRNKSGNMHDNTEEDAPPLYKMTQSMSRADVKTYDTLPDIKGAAVIWHTDEDGYGYVSISESKAESLIESMGTDGENTAEDDGISVWIRTQNGEYISPELKRSPGNVDCAVFEYSPEIAISDEAAKMIANIIEERK